MTLEQAEMRIKKLEQKILALRSFAVRTIPFLRPMITHCKGSDIPKVESLLKDAEAIRKMGDLIR